MNYKKLAVAVSIAAMALCTLAAADNKPKPPKIQPVPTLGGHGNTQPRNQSGNNSATRSENKADEERIKELLLEEKELYRQADAKNQQAKELIRQKNALHNEERSQENTEKVDKKDRRVLEGEVRQESSEQSRLNREADELEHERAALVRQANEKEAERKALEARVRANNSANNGHNQRR
jgi:hypothetical protein